MSHPSLVQLRNPVNQAPKPLGPKHDSLHMAEGMRFCWCMCQRCFMKYTIGGICICRECPCAESYEATKPMYVPRPAVQPVEQTDG
jgi:hypothetical protein